jgi:hypothetical protein
MDRARANSLIDSIEELLGQLRAEVQDRTSRRDKHPFYWRQGAVLRAVQENGGTMPYQDWYRVGAAHGYSPRGLGGLFRPPKSYVEYDRTGTTLRLTAEGEKFISDWVQFFQVDTSMAVSA